MLRIFLYDLAHLLHRHANIKNLCLVLFENVLMLDSQDSHNGGNQPRVQ